MIRCQFDKRIQCGIYHSLSDWDQWGNERFCKKFCEQGKDKTGRRRREIHQRRAMRMRPAYRQKIRGRKVA